MQHPTLPLLHFRSKDVAERSAPARHDIHPHNSAAAGILRGLVVTSLLWGFIGFIVYTVYHMVAGSH